MQSEIPYEFIDTHCHLYFDSFNQDREIVIENARKSGVTKILVPGIDIETSKTAISLANNYPGLYAAVGIHPNQGNDWTINSISEVHELAKDKRVRAIGEIGLDYYRDYLPKEQQMGIFKEQLFLAAELNLPVIIHNRDSSEDLLEILREWYQELITRNIKLANSPGVLHSFEGDILFAQALFELNFKIGIGGPVTYKNSNHLQGLVENIKLQNILIETDSPFLAPHPFRGKRNEPANVRIVAEKISEIKGTSIQDVANTTTAIAGKLFQME